MNQSTQAARELIRIGIYTAIGGLLVYAVVDGAKHLYRRHEWNERREACPCACGGRRLL